jgi:hypothetical protein
MFKTRSAHEPLGRITALRLLTSAFRETSAIKKEKKFARHFKNGPNKRQ